MKDIYITYFLFQSAKGIAGNTLVLAGGPLGNKSPNLQSPPNVSVAKGVVDQMNLGSLPSSIANNVGLQSMANNGNSAQVMSSIQGMLTDFCCILYCRTFFGNIYCFNNLREIEKGKPSNLMTIVD